jgi:hypothetical protein
MNTNDMNKNINAEETIANRCLESCKKLLAGIEQTKNKIAAEFRGIVDSNHKAFQLAISEAEALAWQTDYPQLIFPTLAVEKVQAVVAWQTRQQSVRPQRLFHAQAA